MLDPRSIEIRDPATAVIHLWVPNHAIVTLQATFETYEGIGIVHTVDAACTPCRMGVLTTPDMIESCRKLLEALQQSIGWTSALPIEIKGGPLAPEGDSEH